MLAMLAMLSFAACNVFIGEISYMGPKSINYFGSGSLVFAIVYFLFKAEWSRANPIN